MNQHTLVQAPLPFIDVAAQRRRLGSRIDDAIARVVNHCQFINGPEVHELERDLSAFCGAKHSIGVSSGTDALVLILMAFGVGKGDAVFCPAFTFSATAESVALVGATPVFVDVLEATFNLDPASLERGIATAKRLELTPRAVMVVDLFGLPADYDAIGRIAQKHDLKVIDDAAQSFGATYRNRKVGMLGDITATSFFPAKPLGCYGDGGAVFTDDDDLAALILSLRNHGAGEDRYDNVRIGMNGRLDTIQAAVLIEKLKIFPEEIDLRNKVAARYNDKLAGKVATPAVIEGGVSVWAQYTIETDNPQGLAAHLKTKGVPTAAYYPKPLHQQTAYKDFPVATGSLPASDAAGPRVLSLPMHPYLDDATQDLIIDAVRGFNG